MIALDTNVVSELAKVEPDQEVVSWAGRNARATVITTITVAELMAGVLRLDDGRRKRNLLERIDSTITDASVSGRLWSFDHEAAIAFARLKAEGARTGRPRPVLDLMIAAICIAHEAALATRNVRDFEGLGIDIIDPWAD